jgi:hypothetical protein
MRALCGAFPVGLKQLVVVEVITQLPKAKGLDR